MSVNNPAKQTRAIAGQAAHEAKQMLQSGVTAEEILHMLVRTAEQIAESSAVCSILALDSQGLLRNASSPNLPSDYLAAIDGLKPDAGVGTCASAAATGSIVITRDFQADDKWEELRHLPLSLGFVGAWSMPIKANGKILGTLGTYLRERRSPSTEELSSVETLANAAGLVLNQAA